MNGISECRIAHDSCHSFLCRIESSARSLAATFTAGSLARGSTELSFMRRGIDSGKLHMRSALVASVFVTDYHAPDWSPWCSPQVQQRRVFSVCISRRYRSVGRRRNIRDLRPSHVPDVYMFVVDASNVPHEANAEGRDFASPRGAGTGIARGPRSIGRWWGRGIGVHGVAVKGWEEKVEVTPRGNQRVGIA